jgi:hypothetical protein
MIAASQLARRLAVALAKNVEMVGAFPTGCINSVRSKAAMTAQPFTVNIGLSVAVQADLCSQCEGRAAEGS